MRDEKLTADRPVGVPPPAPGSAHATAPLAPNNLLGALGTLWRWRKQIVLTTAAGAVLAIVISLLLPNEYLGRTAFIALSPEQASIEGTFGASGRAPLVYGTSDDLDRLLSVAESDELIDFMVDSFNLYRVYDIDSTKQKAPITVRREFLSNYEVERNQRDVVELSILDREPERAAEMVTAARNRIDAINLALIRGTQLRNSSSLREQIGQAEAALMSLNERSGELRDRYGVYNTEAQSEALSTQLTTAQAELSATAARLAAFRRRGGAGARDSIAKLEVQLAGLRSARSVLDSQLVNLNSSIGLIDNLEEERDRLAQQLSYDRIRLGQFETVLGADQRTIEVVEESKVPVAKAKPVRWLIVVGATLVTFLLAVLGVLLIDSGRRYDWAAIFPRN